MFVRTLYGREFARLYLNRSDKSKVKRALRFLGMDSLLDKDSEGSGKYGGAQGVRKRGDVVNREVLRWIDRGGSHPFLAFLNYFDVHYPYGGPPTYPKPDWDHGGRIDQYDAGIKYADDAIGRLMQALDRRDLSKNTLVVITADHGESLGQHGLAYHGQALYWELIHVPMVIRYPGHVPAGVRVRVPITSSALPATIMELLGDVGQRIFPGPPLNALWTGPAVGPDWPDALSEVSKNDINSDENKAVGRLVATAADGPMKSAVTAHWHLIVHKKLGDQLYDWVHDSSESNNLVNTALGQQVVRELNSRLETLLARSSEKGRTTTSIALHNGRFDARENKLRHEPARATDDYYRVEAEPGSRLAIEIRAEPLTPANRLDPVVAVLDENGQPYQTCRNPGDDHTPAPGIADPTPDAFDDICVNDDIDPGVNTNARLEILVPGSSKSQVELEIRVSDWNGQAGVQMPYQLQLQEGIVPLGGGPARACGAVDRVTLAFLRGISLQRRRNRGDVKIEVRIFAPGLGQNQVRGVFMRVDLLALYAGPDQVMTVTSGLASVLGLLLIFWNKVVGIFFKIVRKFSRPGYACRRRRFSQRYSQRNSVKFSGPLLAQKSQSSSVWTGSSLALWKRCWNAESFRTSPKFAPPAAIPACKQLIRRKLLWPGRRL